MARPHLPPTRPAASSTAPPPAPRPTLAKVARAAGVSLMTASYALRNNPKISRPVRERVVRVAREIGYTPHPEISRLMHLLRSRRMPTFQATLAMLSFTHEVDAARHLHRYTADVMEGARQRAAMLGYSVDVFHIDSARLSPARLTTMLKSRGIRGVLIPPLAAVENCLPLLDWSQFSIVAANYSAQNLNVNRVVPHHQNNILLALVKLKQHGYHRVGLLLTRDFMARVNSTYQASFALHQQMGDFAPIPALEVEPALVAEYSIRLKHWLSEHRPEILLTVEYALPLLPSLLAAHGRNAPRICLLDHNGSAAYPGIHQHPLIVGEAAVELLAGQVQRGEVGFEKHPRVTMIDGGWLGTLAAARPERRGRR